ncbi:hypothetical protein HOY80DRAFT_1073012 [Tuber brumale]|nr:hypothetical protein HOY80DRAFT_1073012 [Tuber brumale]
MDTIDASDLKRKLPPRASDVGKAMASVAASSVISFFEATNCWVAKNMWGQSRVTVNSRYGILQTLTPQTSLPRRTPATIPSQPADCIEWASILGWPRVIDGIPSNLIASNQRDNDHPEHLQRIYRQELQGPEGVNICSVTGSQYKGPMINIMPASAPTNTIIPDSCCNERLAITRGANPYLNHVMHIRNQRVYTDTFEHEKTVACPVCGNLATYFTVDPEWSLEVFMDKLKQ